MFTNKQTKKKFHLRFYSIKAKKNVNYSVVLICMLTNEDESDKMCKYNYFEKGHLQ